jgi:RNA polymerase sigma-70 factor, ECF subfamily
MLHSKELDSLIDAVLGGERDGFRLILQAYGLSLRSYIAASVYTLEDIDDIAQEVFLVAYRNLREFRRGDDFGAWLRGIARNKVYHHFRRSSRRHTALGKFREQVVRLVEGRMGKAVSADESGAIELLLNCVGALPVRMRRAVRAGLDGDKPTEIAAELGTTVDAVYHLHFRANKLLRDCMQKERSGWTGISSS